MGNILGLIGALGWLTHLFKTFNNGEWLFFFAGLLIPPVGVIHGIYLWF
jgi:hypothetical protein